MVKTAAGALRYVAEKRCPELGLQAAALLQGAVALLHYLGIYRDNEKENGLYYLGFKVIGLVLQRGSAFKEHLQQNER